MLHVSAAHGSPDYPPSLMATRIEIRDLVKTFGGGANAVDRVSITIEPGELFFLLGPSGCGKSTLLRMIAGFTEPSSGQILFDGRDVANLPANQRQTGMVFQSYALWPHMSVADNVGFGLDVRRVAGDNRRKRIESALEGVRMQEYALRRPNQLSGGQQQRVALARAIVIRPDVLLLDEPLSNLDAKLRHELRSEIRALCKSANITTIYVTHDQKEALSMADRIAVLDRGKVVQIGRPREIYERPVNRFVAEFIGETNIIDARVDRAGSQLRVTTPAGSWPAPPGSTEGEQVRLSIRPESLWLVAHDHPEGLLGTIVEHTYLGEVEQYTIDLHGGSKVRVSAMGVALEHGGVVDPDRVVGTRCRVRVRPSGLVTLPT
jgi:iron(III) transport system ATP-binding protein